MISIKLFAVLKKIAGKSSIELDVEGKISFKEFVDAISKSSSEVAELVSQKKVMVSVNQEIADENTVISSGDEIAILPPFAGGEKGVGDLVRVQEGDFSVSEEIARVLKVSTRIGGITTFLGTVRDVSKGKDVAKVTFTHYPGMAEKKLGEIRERALKDFDIIEMAIVHRVGTISPGENIVLIVVGAEHRASTFDACEWAIDELKQITPIWKQEATPEGDVWVEYHP